MSTAIDDFSIGDRVRYISRTPGGPYYGVEDLLEAVERLAKDAAIEPERAKL